MVHVCMYISMASILSTRDILVITGIVNAHVHM